MKNTLTSILVGIMTLFIYTSSLHAQADHSQHSDNSSNANIVKMLKQMQEDIRTLQQSLQKQSMDMGMKGMDMGMMKKMKGMDMGMDMKDKKGMDMGMMGMMKKMKGMNMGMMGMMKKVKGMNMMGKMDMEDMGESSLPGFPGASHIYHIGSSEFFLDHDAHISLTLEQKTKLNKAKQQVKLQSLKADREIEQAEQELWELTSAGAPDIKKIESKIQSIEKLKGAQRLAFIRAVGESVKVLNDKQIKVLVGEEKSSSLKAKEDDHSTHDHEQ